jgi:hypothetical protein
MSNRNVLINSLDSVMTNIALDPIVDSEKIIKEGNWEEFIAKNPNYVQYERYSAVKVANGARELLETQNRHKQKLAGAIIRAHLTDEEITHYGRQEI